MTPNPNVNKQIGRPPPTSFSTQATAIDNTSYNRGRSFSRKRQLSSSSADLMNPPLSRQRSLSVVTCQSVKSSGRSSNPVAFKTHGESFNMSKLVQETLLKPDMIKNIIPPLLDKLEVTN